VLADRLREQMGRTRSGGRRLTVSIGVASCDAGECTTNGLVKSADDALYRAKKSGKNRVVVCPADARHHDAVKLVDAATVTADPETRDQQSHEPGILSVLRNAFRQQERQA
jgi:predicted signal transduction protein with EAL and GGDEF domain